LDNELQEIATKYARKPLAVMLKINITKMKISIILKAISFILFAFSLTCCDPGLNGDLKVFNKSNDTLTVVAFDYGHTDSLTYTIEPNTNKTIKVLGGLGNQKTYDCCPCEYENLYIKSRAGNIKKDPKIKENWIISNKSVQKKYGGEDLKCEFYVTQSDL